MYGLYEAAETRKTSLFSKVALASLSDRIAALGVFGNEASDETNRINYFYANNRFLDFSRGKIFVEDGETSFLEINSTNELYEYLSVQERILDPVQATTMALSDCFFVKEGMSFIDGSLAVFKENLDTDNSFWFSDTNRVTGCTFLVYATAIDELTLRFNNVFVPYDVVVNKNAFSLFPMIGTEGMSAAPSVYIYPGQRIKQTGEMKCYEKAVEPFFTMLVEHSNDEYLDPLTIKRFLEVETDSHVARTFCESVEKAFQSTIAKKIDSANSRKKEDSANAGANSISRLESKFHAKGVITNILMAYRNFLHNNESSESTTSSFVSNNFIAFGKMSTGLGSYRKCAKAKSPLFVQYDTLGACVIDSMLTHVYSPGSSYLQKGITSDLIQAMASTTYSNVIGLYAPMGDNDPLMFYKMEGLSSGDIHIEKDPVLQYLTGPAYVTHRDTTRRFYMPLFAVYDDVVIVHLNSSTDVARLIISTENTTKIVTLNDQLIKQFFSEGSLVNQKPSFEFNKDAILAYLEGGQDGNKETTK